MTQNNFFLANMPASRPADYCLGYMDGSVFIDFNNLDNGCIYLKRISFDGYGCCELTSNIAALNKVESDDFKKIYENNLFDQSGLTTIVKKAIALNKSLIWADALNEYQLFRSTLNCNKF